jgi:YVTN family beta-propeller protein
MRKALLLLALALAAVGAAGCGGGGGGGEADDAAPAAPVEKTITNGLGQDLPPAVTAAIETEGDVWELTAAGDAVWVGVDPPVDALERIDTQTGKVTASIDHAWMSAFDGQDLWVSLPKSLARVDPQSGEIRGEVAVNEPQQVAVGEGAVWAHNATRIVRVDPTAEKVVARIPVPSCKEAKEIEAGLGAVWLACKDSGGVVRVDPATNEVVAFIRTAPGAHHLAIYEESVWVTNYESNTVSRIDPMTNRVVATIPEVGEGVGLTVGNGAVWAGYDAGLAKIDPETNEVVARLPFGPGLYYDLALVDGSLWMTTVTLRHVYRIDPERVT